MDIVTVNEIGASRILDCKAGRNFDVDHYTNRISGGRVAHVRDYRYQNEDLGRDFQIWSIGDDGFEPAKTIDSSSWTGI